MATFGGGQMPAGKIRGAGGLRENANNSLLRILLSREQSHGSRDCWLTFGRDCVPGPTIGPSILEKFSGNVTLQGWLATWRQIAGGSEKEDKAVLVDPSQDRSGETDFIHG